MKDIDPILKINPDTQIIAEQQKEYTFLGLLKVKPGQKVWKVNPDTMEMEILKTDYQINVTMEGKPTFKKRSVVDPAFRYVVAATKRAAIKKFNQKWGTKNN